MIRSAQHCSGGGLSYDDVDLFGRLRSLTIIKGLALPDTVPSRGPVPSRGLSVLLAPACSLLCRMPYPFLPAAGARLP
jgi:hypothetical protein